MFEDRISENYFGNVVNKYIDSTEHMTPMIELKDTVISIENKYWDQIFIGDSLVKLEGSSKIKVYRNKKFSFVLDYDAYFNELRNTGR